MNLGGMGNMMGAVPGGFISGTQQLNQIDQQQLQLADTRAKQAGAQAYFRALQSMFQGGGGQGPQPPMPGQPSMPMQQGGGAPSISPTAMPGQSMFAPMSPSGQPSQADASGVHPSNAIMMPMQSAQASGGGPSSAPGAVPPGVSPAATVPPANGAAPGGQPQLSWQNIVRAVKQSNPGMDDMALASAVDHFMPMMNQQMQADWRNIRSEVMERVALTHAGAKVEAAGVQAGARTEAAGIHAGAKVEAAGIGAQEKAANRDQRERHFTAREERLEKSLQLRTDQGWTRLQQQKDALEQRIRSGDRRQAVVEWRAALDAQHKMAQEKINLTSINNAMKPADKKKLMDDQTAWYSEQIEKLNKLTTQRGNTTDSGVETGRQVTDVPAGQPLPAAKPAAPAQAAPAAGAQAVPVPAGAANDPDGTPYQKDGKTWVKRGNRLVLENGR